MGKSIEDNSLVSFDDIPGHLPVDGIPDNVDVDAVARTVPALVRNLSPATLTPDAIWRDFLALTGTTRTFSSSVSIGQVWGELFSRHNPKDFEVTRSMAMRPFPEHSWIEVGFTFKTSGEMPAECAGSAALVRTQAGDYKIWMLRTWMEHFIGFHSPDKLGTFEQRDYLTEAGEGFTADHGFDYSAVIVGAGQNGLSIAGRLKALGIDLLVVEKNAKVGDTWTNRYESLKLHLTKAVSTLPFDSTWIHQSQSFCRGRMSPWATDGTQRNMASTSGRPRISRPCRGMRPAGNGP